MNKLFAATVMSIFTFGSVIGIATAKQEELNPQQRADLRARAEKLTAGRAEATAHPMKMENHAPSVKKHHATKSKSSHKARRSAKKAQPTQQ